MKTAFAQAARAGADGCRTKSFEAQERRARLHAGQRILDIERRLQAATDDGYDDALYRGKAHDRNGGERFDRRAMPTLRPV